MVDIDGEPGVDADLLTDLPVPLHGVEKCGDVWKYVARIIQLGCGGHGVCGVLEALCGEEGMCNTQEGGMHSTWVLPDEEPRWDTPPGSPPDGGRGRGRCASSRPPLMPARPQVLRKRFRCPVEGSENNREGPRRFRMQGGAHERLCPSASDLQ